MELLCKWCKETKPEDLFVKRVTTDPYSQRNVKCCRECWSVYQKRRYQNPGLRAKQLKANAKWRKAHPDQMARYAKKHSDASPNQVRARNKVRYNVRAGLWQRRPCEVCASMNAEAHHDSYAEPHWETVRWLCKEHHEKWHMIIDPLKNEILEEPIAEVESIRQEAIETQARITALRDKHRELLARADALELSTWNKVVETVQPLYENFARKP